MLRLTFFSVVVLVGLTFAADPDATKMDEKALQGTWQVIAIDSGGVKLPPGALTTKFIFKDGKYSTSHGEGEAGSKGEYKLDATAKPKAIDLIVGTKEKKVDPGIYQLDGDTVKLAIARGPDVKRPTEFKSDGLEVVVFTFKRVKDK